MMHRLTEGQARYLERTLEDLSGRASRREGEALAILKEALADALDQGEATLEILD